MLSTLRIFQGRSTISEAEDELVIINSINGLSAISLGCWEFTIQQLLT
jgi:hypothetical protein